MKTNMKNILVGGILGIITIALILFITESERSLLQFAIGFLLFIIPITFVSSFQSKLMSFLLTGFSILVFYCIYKFNYLDAIFGILLAVLIGGSLFYFRVSRVVPFSPPEHHIDAMIHKENQ